MESEGLVLIYRWQVMEGAKIGLTPQVSIEEQSLALLAGPSWSKTTVTVVESRV